MAASIYSREEGRSGANPTYFTPPARLFFQNEWTLLQRAAQAVATDNGTDASAAQIKATALARSLQQTTTGAQSLATRANDPAEDRDKAQKWAAALQTIAGK